jgi:hypothetical protein
MRLCSEVGEQEEEVSGWQEDVQLSIGRGQDGLEADGNLYWRHESDTTRRRPLWIAGGYREILKAGLESGSGIANTPYQGTDWYKVKVMVGSWASKRQPYCHRGRRKIFPSCDEIEPGPKVQGERAAWKLTVNGQTRRSRDYKLFDVPRPAST